MRIPLHGGNSIDAKYFHSARLTREGKTVVSYIEGGTLVEATSPWWFFDLTSRLAKVGWGSILKRSNMGPWG